MPASDLSELRPRHLSTIAACQSLPLIGMGLLYRHGYFTQSRPPI